MKLLALPLLLAATAAWASTCDSGRRQSPIDIRATVKQKLPALTFDYRGSSWKIDGDGHTVRVRLNAGNRLYIGPQRYTLQQFHFHTPSGDRIDGQEFPMAAHLLHKGSSGELLAVVVLFRIGAENPLLATLLPLIPERGDGNRALPGGTIDMSRLLPTGRAYYRYTGSLTAPPCTEGVEWIILKQPLELSAEQLARYRRRYADTARAVQPLYQRIVLESR